MIFNGAMIFGKTTIVGLILMLTMSCVSVKKKQQAKLWIPKECVDKIITTEDVLIDSNYQVIGKSKLQITYHCTRVRQ